MAQALYSVYSLDLVAAAKENLWRQWGIFDTIMLTKNETTLNPGLLYGLIGFWNTFINGFVSLFRMISPTLPDVAVILGLPIDGEELPSLFAQIPEDMGFKITKKTSSYSSFIATFNKRRGPVEDVEL